jgi:hypothetical protein
VTSDCLYNPYPLLSLLYSILRSLLGKTETKTERNAVPPTALTAHGTDLTTPLKTSALSSSSSSRTFNYSPAIPARSPLPTPSVSAPVPVPVQTPSAYKWNLTPSAPSSASSATVSRTPYAPSSSSELPNLDREICALPELTIVVIDEVIIHRNCPSVN